MEESARRQRVRAIFLEVADLPDGEAEAELDRLCGGDAGVRGEVERLLRAEREAAGFMGSPTATVAGHAGHAAGAGSGTTAIVPILERAGSRVGAYKILQLIGEGGFGTVFLAEQSQPVRRRVALKIIKLGMDTKQVVARFEAERQALAMMDHPHIARVLDGGATESGLPYFVMEYVTGDSITEFAAAHKLSIKDRLTLFAQVCQAVQHAHHKGIIHRDLKPSNVLVTMTDGRPFAKVIDFGIAKATGAAGGTLTDKTLFTEHRQLIGTPEYMSPEQAEGSPDIDTRADVYALGVLLYELLTGVTPIDGRRLRSAAWGEMQRIIKEEEPPKPSVRVQRRLVGGPALRAGLSTQGTEPQSPEAVNATEAAQRVAAQSAARATTPPSSVAATVPARPHFPVRASELEGELDWIVMMALDKDRARRYDTPGSLAADLERHLAGEAVVAAPPSAAYRMRKFVSRNKGAVMAGSAVGVALLVGIAATSIALLAAQHNARAALNNATIAQAARAKLASANSDLAGAARQARLDEASTKYATTDGIVFAEELGLSTQARAADLETVVRTREELLGPLHVETIKALWRLSHVLETRGDGDRAASLQADAADRFARSELPLDRELALCYARAAVVHLHAGEVELSQRWHQRVAEALRRPVRDGEETLTALSAFIWWLDPGGAVASTDPIPEQIRHLAGHLASVTPSRLLAAAALAAVRDVPQNWNYEAALHNAQLLPSGARQVRAIAADVLRSDPTDPGALTAIAMIDSFVTTADEAALQAVRAIDARATRGLAQRRSLNAVLAIAVYRRGEGERAEQLLASVGSDEPGGWQYEGGWDSFEERAVRMITRTVTPEMLATEVRRARLAEAVATVRGAEGERFADERANESYRSAVAARSEYFGPDSPEVMEALYCQLNHSSDPRDIASAAQMIADATEHSPSARLSDPQLILRWHAVACAFACAGDFTAAEEYFRRAGRRMIEFLDTNGDNALDLYTWSFSPDRLASDDGCWSISLRWYDDRDLRGLASVLSSVDAETIHRSAMEYWRRMARVYADALTPARADSDYAPHYTTELRWASLCLQSAQPTDCASFAALGYSHFRLSNHDAAVSDITHAISLRSQLPDDPSTPIDESAPPPPDLAILAMAHFRLAEQGEAGDPAAAEHLVRSRAAMTQLRAIWNDPALAEHSHGDSTTSALVAEAEALSGGS